MMFGWTFMLLLILLAAWMLSNGRWGGGANGRGKAGGEDPAETVLREQYARGDIDEETYRRRLDELRRD